MSFVFWIKIVINSNVRSSAETKDVSSILSSRRQVLWANQSFYDQKTLPPKKEIKNMKWVILIFSFSYMFVVDSSQEPLFFVCSA